MKTKPGHRDDVVKTLVDGAERLESAGCVLYVVQADTADDVTIWVSEVWQSKQHHDDSLHLPEVRAAIGATMPKLTGEFTSHETIVAGGLGV